MIGLLTGRFSAERMASLADGRLAPRSPEFRSPPSRATSPSQDALRPIAERHGASVAAVAIAWTLAGPG